MKSVVSAALCVVLLTACSWRALNPLNWFGGGTQERAVIEDPNIVTDGSVLIEQILSARAEPTPNGVIVHATGMATGQGAYAANLRPVFGEDGRFSYFEFRVKLPDGSLGGSQASRAVVVAEFFPSGKAALLGNISIVGAQNSISIRLR